MGSPDSPMVKRRNFRENPITPEELINCTWYATADDTIGGWCVSTSNKPESQRDPYAGEFSAGNFMTKEVAEHIVRIHNTWWEIEVWKTYMPNIYATYKKELITSTETFITRIKSAVDRVRSSR